MVYHHRRVTCPNCGRIADRTRTVDSQELKGSPFRVCPHCDEVYFDPAYHEVAISIFKDRGGEINFWAFAWVLISNGLVVFFLYNGIKEGSMDGLWLPFLVFLGLALLFDFGLIRLIRNRRHANEYHQKSLDILEGRTRERTGELAASMERMSNKAYLDALKAHGVSVPDYFYERLRNSNVESNIQVPDSVKSIDNSMVQQSNEETETVNEAPTQSQDTNEIVFCRKCGARIPSDSAFCPKCGEKVIKL